MKAIVEKQSNNTTVRAVAHKNEEKESYHMSALITVNGYELQEINGEAVIKDVVLAERLGYKAPRQIREIIKRMIEQGLFGDVVPYDTEEKPENGGRTATAYYLNEKQALKVISKSETKNANDIMDQVLDVFIAWRNGKLQNNSLPTNYIEALEALITKEKLLQNAINTKAEIGSRREATAMATASTATRKANQLEIELDRSKEYCTVKRMEMLNHGQKFKWRDLKSTGIEMGIESVDIYDANYGTVKAYHRDVWMELYAIDLYEFTKQAKSA